MSNYHRPVVSLLGVLAAIAFTWGNPAADPAVAAAAPRRDLMAHAAERYSDKIMPIWVALVEPPAKEGQPERTVVLAREEIGADKWQQLPEMPARVIGLTNHGTELIVVMEAKDRALGRRTWAWFSGDRQMTMSRFSYGPVLPPRMRLLTMAGDAKSLYALGDPLTEAGSIGATRPAAATTGAAAPATQPGVMRAPAGPVLFMLAGNKWTPIDTDWPREAAGAEELASIAVIGRAPHLAVPTDADVVRIYRLNREAGSAEWELAHEVRVAAAPRFIKLLNNDELPALWVQSTDAPGSLWSRKYGLEPIQFSGAKPKPEEVDVTVSSDVRLFFRRDGKPYEQHYSWDGTPAGPPQLLDWTRPRTDPSIHWLTTVFMTVLAVLIVSTLLRRRHMASSSSRDDDRDRGEPEE